MLVKNWKEVWKSYAVLLPAVVLAIYNVLDVSIDANLIPIAYMPFVLVVSGALGWVIKQNNIKKGVADDSDISRSQ